MYIIPSSSQFICPITAALEGWFKICKSVSLADWSTILKIPKYLRKARQGHKIQTQNHGLGESITLIYNVTVSLTSMTGSTVVVSACDGVVGRMRSASAGRSLSAVLCNCSLNSLEARSITTELLSCGPTSSDFCDDQLAFWLRQCLHQKLCCCCITGILMKWIPRSWRN